jgi:aspartyl/asparaginyl beta-hydroxylase (cupin superfamily)/Tfp pilus assembly protein PilF
LTLVATMRQSAMASRGIDQQLQQAMSARAAGRRDEARRLLDAVLAQQPDQPVARNVLGLDAMAAGQAAAAADHFEATLRSEPAAIPVWLNLAGAYRALGRDEDERRALLAALDLDQRQLSALIRLAELHERRGEMHDATMRWAGVAQLASHHEEAPPALQQRFAHARAFVRAQTEAVAERVNAGLADRLSAASPRDRRRLMAASEAMLGRRTIFANNCSGMHYPFLPADEYFDREHFPWLEQLEAVTDVIRAEVRAILDRRDDVLRPYVAMAPGTPENKWSVLDGKRDWSALHLWNEGRRVDEACALAPRTAAIVERLPLCKIPGRAPSVFFSILRAGKHIPAHTGVTNVRAIVHLPLIVPGPCEFRVGGETRAWEEGKAFAFDDTIDHEAWNRSDKDRAVLIIDTWNPHLSEDERTMIAQLFAIADEAKAGGTASARFSD